MTWRKASVPRRNTLMRAAVLADQNEIPDNHALTVRDRVLSTDLERIVQNNVKTDTVTLDLDGEWDDCTVYVTFNDETARSGPWSLEWKGQPLTIPSAVGAVVGPVAVSVVGYGSDGELRLVTEAAPSLLDVVKSGYVEIVDDNEENKDILSQMVAAGKKAEDAAEAADAAATSATSAASSANSAATSANSAATSANRAATKANSAAVDAQNAYETLQPYMATIDSCANVLHREVGPDFVVTADDSFPCKPVEMTVYGNTRQNLWANPSGTGNGLTVTANENGSVTVEGTSTGIISPNSGKRYILKPSTSYTISVNNRLSGSPADPSNGCFFVEQHSQDDLVIPGGTKYVGYGNAFSVTFTTSRELSYAYMGVFAAPGKTLSGTYRVMLNEGSEAEPWCPPGLNSVNGVKVVQKGKNLYGGSDVTQRPYAFVAVHSWLNTNLVGKKVRMSFDLTTENGGRWMVYAYQGYGLSIDFGPGGTGSTDAIIANTQSGVTYHFSAAGTVFYKPVSGSSLGEIIIYKNASESGYVQVSNIQIEFGEVETAYEPYVGTSTPIDLQGHTLNSLPDGTRDELHIDGGGNVTMVQRVGVANAPSEAGSWRFVYDGGEFNVSDTSTSSQDDMTLRNMCDALPVRKAASDPAYAFVSTSYGYAKHPLITDASTAAGIAGGATYLYPLAAPQTIDLGTITPPTMAAPNVTAYVAGDTPAEMALDYVRDVNIVHSRLEERVAALELASATS